MYWLVHCNVLYFLLTRQTNCPSTLTPAKLVGSGWSLAADSMAGCTSCGLYGMFLTYVLQQKRSVLQPLPWYLCPSPPLDATCTFKEATSQNKKHKRWWKSKSKGTNWCRKIHPNAGNEVLEPVDGACSKMNFSHLKKGPPKKSISV